MKQITVRLKEGQDLRQEIERILEEFDINAGVIFSAVGSLSKATVRMPVVDEPIIRTWNEHLEIISVSGAVSKNGNHIHLSFSDINGHVWGGHLKDGCIVRTTVELVIGVFEDTVYRREVDPATGYDELVSN
jgi:uncharacterized protein